MIRKAKPEDLNAIMEIWLDTNRKAHSFVAEEYWYTNLPAVRTAIAEAEVYVFEEEKIRGFAGVVEDYIAGIFVMDGYQSRGIGGALMHHLQKNKTNLSLHVYERNQNAVRFYVREGFQISQKRWDENTSQKEYMMTWGKDRGSTGVPPGFGDLHG